MTPLNISDFGYRCTEIISDAPSKDLELGFYLMATTFIIIIIFFDIKPNKIWVAFYERIKKML